MKNLLSKKRSFLGLYIGHDFVRGFGMSIGPRGYKTYMAMDAGSDSDAIARVIDEIEERLGTHFKGADITGDFGPVQSIIGAGDVSFPRARKILDSDIMDAVCNSQDLVRLSGQTLHLIPLQYILDNIIDATDAAGATCKNLTVKFHGISYGGERIVKIKEELSKISFAPDRFYDPIFLLAGARKKNPALFVELDGRTTRAGASTARGLVSRFDIGIGQLDAASRLAASCGVSVHDAERAILSVISTLPSDSDHYVMAGPKISRANAWSAWMETNAAIIDAVLEQANPSGRQIFLTGPNASLTNDIILKNKGLEAIVLDDFAIPGAFGPMFSHAAGRGVRTRPVDRAPVRAIPIIPSVMCWNTNNAYVYQMFAEIGIKRIHIDVMDGFYTDKVMGGFDQIRKIRARTPLSLHVHLMVDDPWLWIDGAAKSGADIIIVSTGSRRATHSIARIKELNKKCALAIGPDFDLQTMRPELLNMLDEVMIMGVVPGASGQKFLETTPDRIRIMNNTRKRYKFRYKISVDGGIDQSTAPLCWTAGADFLISGSYLRAAPSFDDAVISLLPRK